MLIEDYLNEIFLQLKFPEFWQNSYKKKNNFYKHVFNEAKMYADAFKFDKSSYENEKCALFWHRHCDFCFKEITLDMNENCYCSEDGVDWVCEKCFEENKKTYSWKTKLDITDVPDSFKEVETTIVK